MRRSPHDPSAPGRRFGAVVCLVAVILLWMPVWAAAWHANGTACCEGGMCVAHGHSKTNPPMPREATGDSPINCAQHNDSGIVNCFMSCGHESSSTVTTAVIFVLPVPAAISEPAQALAVPTTFTLTASVPSYDPLSPPPRTSHFSL